MSSDEETNFVNDDEEDYSDVEFIAIYEEMNSLTISKVAPFEIMEEDKVKHHMEEFINKLSSIIRSRELCKFFLYKYRWNVDIAVGKYYEYIDSENSSENNNVKPDAVMFAEELHSMDDEVCEICFEEANLTGLNCGHYYCKTCWNSYIRIQIHETSDLCISCPKVDCVYIANEKCIMNLLETSKEEEFYQKKIRNSFIQNNEFFKWCPAPDCSKVVMLNTLESRNVVCECGHSFCFDCFDDCHEPIPCSYLKRWKKQYEEDKETNERMIANTKDCPNPKCGVTIEKYGECDFVRCTSCGQRFCWVCLQLMTLPLLHRYFTRRICNGESVTMDVRPSLNNRFEKYSCYIESKESSKENKTLVNKIKEVIAYMYIKKSSKNKIQCLESAVESFNNSQGILMYSYIVACFPEYDNSNHVLKSYQYHLQSAIKKLKSSFNCILRDTSNEFNFSNEMPCQPFYRPGETLTGYVIVELSKPKKINKVCLKAYGRAYVSFWVRHEEKNESCTDEKTYLKTHLTLWDKNNAGGQKEMSAGKHQYPFSIIIPYDAPPSVDISGGNIQYSLKAELDIPWAIDKHHEVKFIVGAHIDMNSAPIYAQPQSACIQKTGIFSSSNSMHATISIPRLAWTAGEVMPIDCNITNNSSNDISGIEVKIIRNEYCIGHMVAHHYHQRTQENFKSVVSKRIDMCIPASSSKQVQIDFGIPPNLVTIMNYPILSVKYELKIELHTKGILSTCPSTCLPIVFSNIPVIYSPQYAQPSLVGFQPPPAFPEPVIHQAPYSQPYPNYPVPPATGQGTIPVPQYTPYPNVPPLPPYPSNPPIGGANTPSPGEYQTLSYGGTL